MNVILNISWVAYNALSVTVTILAPSLFGVVGLTDPQVLHLFILLLLGVSLNAHANLSNEFLQASGRYHTVAVVNLFALTIMNLSFLIFANTNGILMVGWAWILSQAGYSLLIDHITIRRLPVPNGTQLCLLLFRIAVLSASIGVVLWWSGWLPNSGLLIVLATTVCVAGWTQKRRMNK